MSMTSGKRLPHHVRVEAGSKMNERDASGKRKYSVTSLSQDLSISRKHLYSLEKAYKENPQMPISASPGRPSSIDERMKRRVIREIRKNPFTSSVKMAKDINTALPDGEYITSDNIKKIAVKSNLKAYTPAIRPRLTADHIRKRVKWVREWGNMSADFWTSIIFSDEVSIELFAVNKKTKVRRAKGDRYEPKYVLKKGKYAVGKLNFWGAISYYGPNVLVKYENTMKATDYRKLLVANLLPMLDEIGADRVWFQDDGATAHRANIINMFKENNKILQLPDWPPNSPDLSPIENLWAIWKERVNARNAKDIVQLEKFAFEEWQKISQVEIQGLYKSIPSRIEAIKRSKGKQTRY